jgi:sugar phosphate isomerase/epimerase
MRDRGRRRLLSLLGTAPLAPWLSPVPRGRQRNGLWSTAIALSGFAACARVNRRSYATAEIFEFAARAGFDGVELSPSGATGPYPRAVEEDRVHKLEGQLEPYGLHPFALRLPAGDLFAPEATRRSYWQEEAEERVALAARLGAGFVEIAPVGALRGGSVEEALLYAAGGLRSTAEAAARRRVMVALNLEPGSVFGTAEQLATLLGEIRHPLVRPVYDPAAFERLAPGRHASLLAQLGPARLAYARLPAATRDRIDLGWSLRALRVGGFRGWIVVDPAAAADPYDACARIRAVADVAARNS